ncbi:MAG TPA: hypothetical protein VFA55_02055, partial [Candidatus Kapabacteria bacterium]|nr:hypothetical protein [Candidatus Kapabacteria bacterium]
IFGALIVLAIDFVSSNDLFPIGTAIALLIGAAIYIIYYSYKLFNRLEKETGRNPNDTMRV